MAKGAHTALPAESPLQTVDRALRVLELFGPLRTEITGADVARWLDVDRSIAARLLAALAARGFITQDAATGRYRLGIRVLDLGSLYLQSNRLVAAAAPYLELLASQTGAVANLFVLHEGQAFRLASYPARPMTGVRVPAHCTAAGKVLLAALSEAELDQVLANRGLPGRTRRTITTADALATCLAQVRDGGYATEVEELHLGSACIAAPIRDVTERTVAAMSVALPASRITESELPGLIDAVRGAAARTSEGLGYGPLDPPSPAGWAVPAPAARVSSGGAPPVSGVGASGGARGAGSGGGRAEG